MHACGVGWEGSNARCVFVFRPCTNLSKRFGQNDTSAFLSLGWQAEFVQFQGLVGSRSLLEFTQIYARRRSVVKSDDSSSDFMRGCVHKFGRAFPGKPYLSHTRVLLGDLVGSSSPTASRCVVRLSADGGAVTACALQELCARATYHKTRSEKGRQCWCQRKVAALCVRQDLVFP